MASNAVSRKIGEYFLKFKKSSYSISEFTSTNPVTAGFRTLVYGILAPHVLPMIPVVVQNRFRECRSTIERQSLPYTAIKTRLKIEKQTAKAEFGPLYTCMIIIMFQPLCRQLLCHRRDQQCPRSRRQISTRKCISCTRIGEYRLRYKQPYDINAFGDFWIGRIIIVGPNHDRDWFALSKFRIFSHNFNENSSIFCPTVSITVFWAGQKRNTKNEVEPVDVFFFFFFWGGRFYLRGLNFTRDNKKKKTQYIHCIRARPNPKSNKITNKSFRTTILREKCLNCI